MDSVLSKMQTGFKRDEFMKILLSPALRVSLIFAIFLSSISAIPLSQSTISTETDTQQVLADLGGVPCFEDSYFTCVTIDVPLNHFDPADTRTIPVVFAVLPASGTRKGMFVTATGGPGTSGVWLADSYSAGYDPSILESFDIVFFDQRGMGMSGGLTCPVAATEYYQQDARGLTPKQEQALKKTTKTFVADCVDELGSTDLLPYLSTRQAVEDLEVFRQLVGDEKFWLYGESYGTQYAQTYAAAHREHLAGLILDATVDLTFSGNEYYAQQAQAFNDTLVAALSVCNEDPVCAEQMNGDAIAAYDILAAKLSKNPISFKFPVPNGKLKSRKFTLSDLEFVAATQMYGESDRMMFTRALAAYTANDDIIPLARLLYIDLAVDPQTLDIIPDDSWSDAIFYGVECQDYGYPGSTPNERAELYLDAADPFETSIPRLASIIYGDLPCAYWPSASSNLTRPGYLSGIGVPTLILGATADPATPVSHGINVYQNLGQDAYLITTQGGPHVTFGYGNECPDALVTNFLVNDIVPDQRETVCEGYIADDFVPVAPRTAKSFSDPLAALLVIETEIYHLPEFYYWDGYTPTSVGCTYGGTLYFDTEEDGTTYNVKVKHCQLVANFGLTGSGWHDTVNERMSADLKITGRWSCTVHYERTGDQVHASGKCNGKPFNIERTDENSEWHDVPNLNEPKEDS
jgi:pimeloyl-ACP methyl ester carboxylesterase